MDYKEDHTYAENSMTELDLTNNIDSHTSPLSIHLFIVELDTEKAPLPLGESVSISTKTEQ